ncbi:MULTISPECIES: hypothetical protein [unclassified Vibrio]|uniref:Uncharacterized protein n=1 Tax=Vibrio sp. HB236076 TaxID=3232307 RepID=A0AB39HH28_9VIBR|nr:hypothetical protein [Vibrio sp. HB161653]MDP5254329.1 hypothetical protein [Vibrio sp. HB161653]
MAMMEWYVSSYVGVLSAEVIPGRALSSQQWLEINTDLSRRFPLADALVYARFGVESSNSSEEAVLGHQARLQGRLLALSEMSCERSESVALWLWSWLFKRVTFSGKANKESLFSDVKRRGRLALSDGSKLTRLGLLSLSERLACDQVVDEVLLEVCDFCEALFTAVMREYQVGNGGAASLAQSVSKSAGVVKPSSLPGKGLRGLGV